ncbi:hypothetical protein [Hymenobacter psychrotolerans]|uniref:hypothetical protein n=1 Tax=Hymenobacter psychrotolerans TaxID=344998 RepID=UPI0009338315|nr:hypothetical protein [Hymenobacter psychrotolerans]
MVRLFLLLCYLVLFSGIAKQAVAQASPDALFAVSSNSESAGIAETKADIALMDISRFSNGKQDTLRAIAKLFARRRTAGIAGMSIGAVSLTMLVPMALASTDFMSVASGVGLLGVMPTAIGTAKYIRFSSKKEVALLVSYTNGAPLPERIIARLRPRYFR